MRVEGPMILVQSAVNQVSSTAFLNPFISTVGVDEVFIDSFIMNNGCDWAQELSMFNDGSINTEHAFEENIDTFAAAKKFMQALHCTARIKEHKYCTPVVYNRLLRSLRKL